MEIITKLEIENDMSPMAQVGIADNANEIIRKLKRQGYMAPEICYIAHCMLESQSEHAHRQIKMFGKDGELDKTLKDVEALLEQLKGY